MKYITLIIVVILTSCYIPADTGLRFDDVQDVISWVADNIKYRSDKQRYDESDYWQMPQQTLARGTGDCEDFVILDMQLLWEIGIESHMVLIPGHAMLLVHNTYCEATSGMWAEVPDDISGVYGYYSVMNSLEKP
uniref:Putative peptidase n=1 Tax=viral metagenome TaxID=1070528 RepID=A0A6M3KZW9_9ZZZZ